MQMSKKSWEHFKGKDENSNIRTTGPRKIQLRKIVYFGENNLKTLRG